MRYNGRSQIVKRVAIGIFFVGLLVFALANLYWSFFPIHKTLLDVEVVAGCLYSRVGSDADSATPNFGFSGRFKQSRAMAEASFSTVQDGRPSVASAIDPTPIRGGLRRRQESSLKRNLNEEPLKWTIPSYVSRSMKTNSNEQDPVTQSEFGGRTNRRGSNGIAEPIKLSLAAALKWREDRKKRLPADLPNPECLSKLKGRD